MKITEAESLSLQQQGANARAAGSTEFDCPLFKPDQMPAATGEPATDWSVRVNAWRLGFAAEAAIRG